MAWGIGKLLKRLLVIIIVIVAVIFVITVYLTINYPISYQKTIDKYSKQFNIDPYLIAAIINVESRYDKNAISHKEARGLMQISPSTGSWGAEALSIENFDLDMLFEPETNIMIGTWYINMLSKEFGDNFQLIVAAYNGGSGNVSKWLKDSGYSDDGKSLKQIPFQETKNYVERVAKNYSIYSILYRDEFYSSSAGKESRAIIVIHSFRKLFKSLVRYK